MKKRENQKMSRWYSVIIRNDNLKVFFIDLLEITKYI